MTPRKLLILDLDETLMFATAHPPDNLWTHELANFKVYVRPYLAFFLDEIKKDFDIAVWSSAYLQTLRDAPNVRVIEKRNWRNETKRTC